MKVTRTIATVALIILMVSLFSGCASAPQRHSDLIKISDIKEPGISQLLKNLNKEKLIPDEATKMQHGVIGATAGYRFAIKLDGGDALVEFYEFNKNNLNDSAKAVISSVKKDGHFTILDIHKPISAELSKNEKYLMIYNDTKSTGDKPDSSHKERRDKIKGIFDNTQ